MSNSHYSEFDEEDYLHLGALILDYARFLRKRWYLLVILVVACVGVVLGITAMNYQPFYSATAYYKVEQTDSLTINAAVASRVAANVRYLTSLQEFDDELRKNLSEDIDLGSYYFYGVTEDDTNLFSVHVISSNPKCVNDLLNAFEIVFPEWISYSTGSSVRMYSQDLFVEEDAGNSWFQIKTLILAVILGCAIWFVIATIMIFSVRRICGEVDLYQLPNAPCLGVIPDVVKKKRAKEAKDSLIITRPHIDQSYQQTVSSLRSRLERTMKEKNHKVFVIASTESKEGKSLLSMNLALSLGLHGKKVLFINGDLEKRRTNKQLNFDSEQLGLSDFLMGKEDALKSIIVKYQGIYLIPSGKSCEEFHGAIITEKMDLLMEQLREMMDVIIIDTPPMSLFGDAEAFSTYADEVLYLIRGNFAEVKNIRKGIAPFYRNGKLGGYILNRVNSGRSIYGSYYGYGGRYSRYRNYEKYGKYNSNHYEKDGKEEE